MSQMDEDAKDFSRMLRYVQDCIRYYQEMKSLPNCNTCGKRDCKYKPGWGLPVRINCPLWEAKN